MRALLIDASTAGDMRTVEVAEALKPALEARGWSVERIRLADLEIAPCKGCFGCWFKRPGECLVDDDARRLAASLVASDLFAIATPVRFGSYGWLAKNALDRMIPLHLPYFTLVRGEVHHTPRYNRAPLWLMLGTSALAGGRLADETVAFERLIARNAVNAHSPAHASALVGPADDPAAVAAAALRALLGPKEATA